tara:strand:+ start:456 stop:674 length:219 start_codon:yes stop_codon:yes gene_type:complete
MSKIIIENRCEFLPDETALELVQKVIQGGRVSNNNKQYCYLTRFNYGENTQDFMVATDLNKKSDKFIVYETK